MSDEITKRFNDALAALNSKDLKRAEKLFRRVIEIDTSHVPALNLLAIVLMSMERFDDAEQFIERATSLNQKSDVSFYNYGLISKQLNKPRQALENFSKALTLNPNVPETWNNRGTIFNDLKDYDLAIADFDKAISSNGLYSEAYANKGKSLTLLKRYKEALAAYDKALSIKPDLAEVWLGRGNVFAHLKRYDEAFSAYDKALSIKPDLAEAWLGRGNVFTDLKRYDEAFAAYDKALSIKPDLENAWLGRGNVFTHLKRYDEAFAAYDKALSIKPDLAEAWLGRGNAFTDLRRYEEAFAAYDRAFALNCDLIGVEGSRLYAKLHCCLWSDLGADAAKLITSIRLGKENSPPLCALCIDASPDDQLRCADSWVKKNIGNVERQKVNTVVGAADKIRLGYLSADLRAHPVGYLAAGLFESHNRDRFETYAFSIGPNDNSDLRNRIEKSFYKFVDLNNRTDDEISTAIRSAKIDILVDLMGHTYGSRPAVLARHPAPILVNYLGFAGTTGDDLSDYIIVDKTVVDDSNKEYFSEKMAFLPHCFLPHDEKGRTISDKLFTRQDQGLPEEGFVFCCFNSAYKINPNVFTRWMNILKKVDGAVLWLSGLNETAKKNLRQEAEERGVGSNRLVFSKHLALPADHLARQCVADLFLDTLPYNAHTTASDALWAGVPVLTQIGDTFAGRVATSLLNAVGLPELITRSPEEYEALAVALALDRENLQNIRKKLGKNRLTTPLFDTPLYARHLELVYEAMYRRNKSGLPPDHIEIQPLTADFRGG